MLCNDANARYTIKYKNTKGALTLTITSGKKVYKYKTSQTSDVKLLERANSNLLKSLTQTVNKHQIDKVI